MRVFCFFGSLTDAQGLAIGHPGRAKLRLSPICRRQEARAISEHFRPDGRATWEMLTSFRLAALDLGLRRSFALPR